MACHFTESAGVHCRSAPTVREWESDHEVFPTRSLSVLGGRTLSTVLLSSRQRHLGRAERLPPCSVVSRRACRRALEMRRSFHRETAEECGKARCRLIARRTDDGQRFFANLIA